MSLTTTAAIRCQFGEYAEPPCQCPKDATREQSGFRFCESHGSWPPKKVWVGRVPAVEGVPVVAEGGEWTREEIFVALNKRTEERDALSAENKNLTRIVALYTASDEFTDEKALRRALRETLEKLEETEATLLTTQDKLTIECVRLSRLLTCAREIVDVCYGAEGVWQGYSQLASRGLLGAASRLYYAVRELSGR